MGVSISSFATYHQPIFTKFDTNNDGTLDGNDSPRFKDVNTPQDVAKAIIANPDEFEYQLDIGVARLPEKYVRQNVKKQ